MNGAPFTLHFTEWECGHHMQRPADIPVDSSEQAVLIAWAIAHAISQPGHARAVVMDATRAETIYITDDYVAVGHADSDKIQERHHWSSRPVLVLGNPADIEAIYADELAGARDVQPWVIEPWDGSTAFYGDEVASTTLSQAEVEAMARPHEPYEARPQLFNLPPVFRAAADLLAELREEAAEQAEDEANDGSAS